jgi:hypothetical protein
MAGLAPLLVDKSQGQKQISTQRRKGRRERKGKTDQNVRGNKPISFGGMGQ